MRYTLLGPLLIAMIHGSMAQASYVCFEASDDLQPCNFERMQRAPAKPDIERNSKLSNGAVMESLYQAPDGTVVVYKLEGCIPGRLPFTLPKCKTEDKIGKPVEVRRLFPFVIAGEPPTAPLIFPEVEAAKLYKSSGDLKEEVYDPVISREEVNKELPAKLSKRKKELMLENSIKKSRKSLNFDAMFPGYLGSERKKESIKSKDYKRINDIDEADGLKKSSKSNNFQDALDDILYSSPEDYNSVRPLSVRRLLDQLKYSPRKRQYRYPRAIPLELEQNENLLRREFEEWPHYRPPKFFPYEKALPFDEMEFGQRMLLTKVNHGFRTHGYGRPFSKVKRENRLAKFAPQSIDVLTKSHRRDYTSSLICPYDRIDSQDLERIEEWLTDIKQAEASEKNAEIIVRGHHHQHIPPLLFPYEKSVPYDPKMFGDLLPLDMQEKELARIDHFKETENPMKNHHHEYAPPLLLPYEKSIPYDPKMVAGLQEVQLAKTELQNDKNLVKSYRREYDPPAIFPYEKSVRYDPKKHGDLMKDSVKYRELLKKAENKLHKREIADQGSEFPYDKALPFNHWKVSEFRRRLEAQSRSLHQGRSSDHAKLP